jgi:hypothetical protein
MFHPQSILVSIFDAAIFFKASLVFQFYDYNVNTITFRDIPFSHVTEVTPVSITLFDIFCLFTFLGQGLDAKLPQRTTTTLILN